MLSSFHVLLLHTDNRLFRLEDSANQSHFVSTEEKLDVASAADGTTNIQFGVSVLQWLRHDETPHFASLREEITNHPQSSVPAKLYLTYSRECFFKMRNHAHEHFELDELVALKVYTDTNDFQSSLRKAHRESAHKETKRSFFQWALQLYKTSLYHAKHLPRWTTRSKAANKLYHGTYFSL